MSNNIPNTEKWHRLEQVIKWTGLSINAFALHIGLKRSENLYQIKKGNNGISHDLAELITAKYPSISKGWLLTGEGEMMIDQKRTSKNSGIPCYGMDAVEAVEMLERTNGEQLLQPQFYIDFPPLKRCDLAALSLSDAMQPEVPAGSYVLLRRQNPDELLPGAMCLILSETFKVYGLSAKVHMKRSCCCCLEIQRRMIRFPSNGRQSANCLWSKVSLSRKFCDLCFVTLTERV